MNGQASQARYVDTGNNDKWQVVEFGLPGSLQYRMMFLDKQCRAMSPWHSIPLYVGEGQLNFLCKAPKGTWGRFELADDEDFNPLRLMKNKSGKAPAHFSENCKWNVGVLPQTWADPEQVNVDYGGLPYDGAPVEVLDIGSRTAKFGEVYPVKLLAAFAVISNAAKLSWKIVAIAAEDLMCGVLSDVADVNRSLPGTLEEIREWLRVCLCSESSEEENLFGMNERAADQQVAAAVLAECHGAWQLLNDNIPKPEPWLPRAKPMKPSTFESMWVKYTELESKDSIPLSGQGNLLPLQAKLREDSLADPAKEEPDEDDSAGGGKPRKLLGFLKAKPRFARPAFYKAPAEDRLGKEAGAQNSQSLQVKRVVDKQPGGSRWVEPNSEDVARGSGVEEESRRAARARTPSHDMASKSPPSSLLRGELKKVPESVKLTGQPRPLPPTPSVGEPTAQVISGAESEASAASVKTGAETEVAAAAVKIAAETEAPAATVKLGEVAEVAATQVQAGVATEAVANMAGGRGEEDVVGGKRDEAKEKEAAGKGGKGGEEAEAETVTGTGEGEEVVERSTELSSCPDAASPFISARRPKITRSSHASQDSDERGHDFLSPESEQESGDPTGIQRRGRVRSMGQMDGARLVETLGLEHAEDSPDIIARHARSQSMGALQAHDVLDRTGAGEDYDDPEQDEYAGSVVEEYYEDEEVLDAVVVRYADGQYPATAEEAIYAKDYHHGQEGHHDEDDEWQHEENESGSGAYGRTWGAFGLNGRRGLREGMHGFQRVETMPLKGSEYDDEDDGWTQHQMERSASASYADGTYRPSASRLDGKRPHRAAEAMGPGYTGELLAAALAPEIDEDEWGHIPEATVISRHNSGGEQSDFSEPEHGQEVADWDQELEMDLPVATVMDDFRLSPEQGYDQEEQYKASCSVESHGGAEGHRGHRRKVSFAEIHDIQLYELQPEESPTEDNSRPSTNQNPTMSGNRGTADLQWEEALKAISKTMGKTVSLKLSEADRALLTTAEVVRGAPRRNR